MKKKLGILGGMGSYATQVFFKNILDHTKVECDNDHLDILIYNHSSIPDRTEYILSGREDELFAILLEDCKMLQNMGCEHIAISCNTSHYFADRLQENIDIPIINMVRETVNDIYSKTKKIKKIGIMATKGTVTSDIYGKECRKLGIEAVYPSDEMQEKVTDIIYNQIKRSLHGNYEQFLEISEELLNMGAEVIVLSCTELSVFKSEHNLPSIYVDALDVLTKKCIVLSGGIYEENKLK
jgi:aspartate racemase